MNRCHYCNGSVISEWADDLRRKQALCLSCGRIQPSSSPEVPRPRPVLIVEADCLVCHKAFVVPTDHPRQQYCSTSCRREREAETDGARGGPVVSVRPEDVPLIEEDLRKASRRRETAELREWKAILAAACEQHCAEVAAAETERKEKERED